uniref:CSON003699 protein n=1 Tax=Culicoides sonorensis TaxID=179676 RepID=A0A336LID3_CULSO
MAEKVLEASCSTTSEVPLNKIELNDIPRSTVQGSNNEDFYDQSLVDIEEELKKLDGGSDVHVVKAVQDELNDQYSKSKNNDSMEDSLQTNLTANSNPHVTVSPSVDPASIKSLANGSLPKTGKPMMLTLDKNSKRKITKARGRPKQKAFVGMYQSQLKDNNLGIKLCIKKSDLSGSKKKPNSSSAQGGKSKQPRKRSRKSKQHQNSDSDISDYEKRPKKDNKNKSNNNTENENEIKQAQSLFAERLPQHILHKVIAISPSLWRVVDLSNWPPRDRQRTELNLKWLIENRLLCSTDLNLSNWKIKNVDCVFEKLLEAAPNLEGIALAGWKELTSDQLLYLVEEFKKLSRLDLSSINSETNIGKTAVGAASICTATQKMGDRLTHLYLANNRLANLPQIISTLSTHCPNLELLDLSNVTTIAASHGILHVEKFQHGCQKLKVLRITNSHITLSPATVQEQMESPGFPDLEELSIASLADESRIFNDDCLQRILKSSTKLKLLDVRGCARLTHDSLIRLPTWDLKHLFLSGCSVTRDTSSGLELVASKYAHSLTELDLAWANATDPLDNALKALAEKGDESPLSHLNLCGSSVSVDAVKEILINCPALSSINLSSCRGLPRGVKRPLQGVTEIAELRENLGAPLKYAKPKIDVSVKPATE